MSAIFLNYCTTTYYLHKHSADTMHTGGKGVGKTTPKLCVQSFKKHPHCQAFSDTLGQLFYHPYHHLDQRQSQWNVVLHLGWRGVVLCLSVSRAMQGWIRHNHQKDTIIFTHILVGQILKSFAVQTVGGEFFQPIGSTNGSATSGSYPGFEGDATSTFGISSGFTSMQKNIYHINFHQVHWPMWLRVQLTKYVIKYGRGHVHQTASHLQSEGKHLLIHQVERILKNPPWASNPLEHHTSNHQLRSIAFLFNTLVGTNSCSSLVARSPCW